jgi:hypothetical protein
LRHSLIVDVSSRQPVQALVETTAAIGAITGSDFLMETAE